MQIKLVSPRMSLRPMDSEYKRVLSPSLSLLILASLTPKEHNVYIEDENVSPLNMADSPNLVAITVNVDTSKRAYQIADSYRERCIPVILGGIHPSSCPEEGLEHADSVCIGEAEGIWQDILSDTQSGKLRPKYYKDVPVDLSMTPSPQWDILNRSKYLYTNIICATRGCPFKCDFCYNSCEYVHNCYRNRPIDNIVAEITALKTRQVMFIDDNLIGNISWTKELVRALQPLGLTWHAAVSTNIGSHLDLLDQMNQSGCKSLFIGFETINDKSNGSVGKSQNHTTEFGRLIREIHERDIMVNASMVFGFDHDAPSVFKNTLDWLVENKVETMTGHILTPYPGTRLYKRLFAEGRIIDFDPAHYNTAHVVFQPRNMSVEELHDGYIEIYRQVYSLPNIYRRMPDTMRRRIPYLLFNLGYRKYGKVMSLISKFNLMNFTGKLATRLSYGIG
jgi:radical SAM superfamily enzyme YgiQ (UPF0313 family)